MRETSLNTETVPWEVLTAETSSGAAGQLLSFISGLFIALVIVAGLYAPEWLEMRQHTIEHIAMPLSMTMPQKTLNDGVKLVSVANVQRLTTFRDDLHHGMVDQHRSVSVPQRRTLAHHAAIVPLGTAQQVVQHHRQPQRVALQAHTSENARRDSAVAGKTLAPKAQHQNDQQRTTMQQKISLASALSSTRVHGAVLKYHHHHHYHNVSQAMFEHHDLALTPTIDVFNLSPAIISHGYGATFCVHALHVRAVYMSGIGALNPHHLNCRRFQPIASTVVTAWVVGLHGEVLQRSQRLEVH